MAARKPPWGKRQQTETGPIDDVLNALARNSHPTAAWWYGRGPYGGDQRLVCYICDEVLYPRNPAHALGAEAVKAVMEHRTLEIERTRPRVHSTPEE